MNIIKLETRSCLKDDILELTLAVKYSSPDSKTCHLIA